MGRRGESFGQPTLARARRGDQLRYDVVARETEGRPQ
jgi:hypothetical protein